MPGIVYVLTNPEMPGLIKIGITSGDIEARIRSLDNTSVPVSFVCFYAAEVTDPNRVEKAVHEAFGDHRVRPNREFFRLSPDKAVAIIRLLETRDVTPRNDVVSEPGDQAALDQARRRRSNFRFSVVGIQKGALLHSVFDDDITCVVHDDRRVIFRGEEDSLSNSALTVAKEKGYSWSTIAGPAYWKYEGRTLSEIREEISPELEELLS
jgi:hypothetical protein